MLVVPSSCIALFAVDKLSVVARSIALAADVALALAETSLAHVDDIPLDTPSLDRVRKRRVHAME